MKLKGFDKVQHYLLDAIWKREEEGRDVAATLRKYIEFVDGSDVSPEDMIEHLHRQLSDRPAIDPDNGQWRTWGFVAPFPGQPEDIYVSNPLEIEGEYQQALAVNVHETSTIVLCVEKRERVLPSSAINDKLFDRAKEFKEREDRELTRKDYAVLKDEVTAALLKTAPVRRSRIYVAFRDRDLFVFTGSQKAAEDVTAVIRSAFSSLPTIPAFNNEVVVQQFFKKVLQHDDEVFEKVEADGSVKLRNEEGEVITVKDGDLDDSRYGDLLKQGFVPVELALLIHINKPGMRLIQVKMNQKGDVKSISTSSEADENEFEDMYERGEAGFQTKMAELWVFNRVLGEFIDVTKRHGLTLDRDELDDTETGDELAMEEEAANKAKGKGETATAGDDVDFEDDGSEEGDDDDTWDL